MLQAIQRNAIMVAGIAACGFVGIVAAPWLISPRGDWGPTVLGAQSPIAAMLALIVGLAISAVIAGVIGRLINSVVGMFVLGVGLFALDGRLESIRVFAYANHDVSPKAALALLALETLVLALLMLGATLIVFGIGGRLRDVQPPESGESPNAFTSVDALKSAAAGAIVLATVYIIAQSSMKGQIIGAMVIGGMLAGLVARLFAPHVQPVLIFCSPLVFGALGYLIALVWVKSPLDVAYITSGLPTIARPTPLDYAAGSIMGVAIGLGWARSFLHHEEPVSAPAS